MKLLLACALTALLSLMGAAHPGGHYAKDPFRQIDELLPDPNEIRAANGAPGPEYWQQRADYKIKVVLDDKEQRISGSETIAYTNNSSIALTYLWVQLDQNRFEQQALGHQAMEAPDFDSIGFRTLRGELSREDFEGGYQIKSVHDDSRQPLSYSIIDTMMRVEVSVKPGATTTFGIDWEHNIVNAKAIRARGGYEYFKEDDNYIYTIAQWYPRIAAFTDINGWQNKQFLGRGEFALEFGDYEVSLTVPADHIVAATGTLANPGEVLSNVQQERLKQAEGSDEPTYVVTPAEAKENEKSKAEGSKTWVFRAENVRDFAWASSRKFVWDAAHVKVGSRADRVWAMSFFPNEGEPLWSKYSTHSVIHALQVFSKHTFDYPYPVAISVHGPVFGMEYPMICFNGPRPEDDGTYSRRTKYALISVVIHEVGHNWFPMIVNSDERQWTWMDEGLTTFCQFLAEREWEEKYPSRRGMPPSIASYMKRDDEMPIMTNSESLRYFGSNAYAKPAVALNILRESVLGRENFDYAFKEYANRWKFKRPTPADFFRTMEDASGVDLDWFWTGWFYTSEHVDLAIKGVKLYQMDTKDPDIEKTREKAEREEEDAKLLTNQRNIGIKRYTDRYPDLLDFYNANGEYGVTKKDRDDFQDFLKKLEEHEREILEENRYFYQIDLTNEGGLVMPVVLKVLYEDGEAKIMRLPAELWKRDSRETSKLLVSNKKVVSIELDPNLEIADSDRTNNEWPAQPEELRFTLEKDEKKNLMQRLREEKKKSEEGKE
ncbi:MAG TPA: aminopeptidase [Verrucomicrobiales bacterium]|nr:aminopeptidase [Roseibacillus sp.]HBM78454.1 aminopeptidase [Verrucomicrobiales bacterium]